MVSNVRVYALFETRVKRGIETIQKKFEGSWLQVQNYEFSPKGIIWVGQDIRFAHVDVLDVSIQCCNTTVTEMSTNQQWNVCFVYGLHTIADRKGFWPELSSYYRKAIGGWVVMGNFNIVFDSSHRINGNDIIVHELVDGEEWLVLWVWDLLNLQANSSHGIREVME